MYFRSALLLFFNFIFCLMLGGLSTQAQDKSGGTNAQPKFAAGAGISVKTYINPILAGDHPDPTLFKFGNDFYMCGSSFHFVPNLPILHSKDLLHWETIARVIPADWADLKSGAPGAGIWQGAITYFYGSFYIYFSNSAGGGQYFSKAATPAGPWSLPQKVKTTADTGPIGYDNSVFVDDDGTPYMIIKPGQTTNRIQQIGNDGNLTAHLINLDWINHDKKYSWAEGPVMCKRNGWYYYFMAGDVTGGQYGLRSRVLTADSTKWENLGKIFAFSRDPENRFRSSNHMSAPFQLANGTWWCIAQSYDAPPGDDWSGQGRQDLLLQVQWTPDGKPFVPYPADGPLTRPDLENNGRLWCLPRSDDFKEPNLSLSWHFMNKAAAAQYSLTGRPGWLRINPGPGKSAVLQKEGGRYYALVTKVNINSNSQNEQAGIYLASGNESVNVRFYSGFDGEKKICFVMGTQSFSIKNNIGDTVWLKLVRNGHNLTGFCSADGTNWTPVGAAVDARDLDKNQPNFNAWVGTSMGLYAAGKPADFDLFLYKDGFSDLPLAGCNNYFGVKIGNNGDVMLNTNAGGWLMLGGVDIGHTGKPAKQLAIVAASTKLSEAEVWIDDLMGQGKKIATLQIKPTGGLAKWQTFSSKIPVTAAQHDLFIRIKGTKETIALKSIRLN